LRFHCTKLTENNANLPIAGRDCFAAICACEIKNLPPRQAAGEQNLRSAESTGWGRSAKPNKKFLQTRPKQA